MELKVSSLIDFRWSNISVEGVFCVSYLFIRTKKKKKINKEMKCQKGILCLLFVPKEEEGINPKGFRTRINYAPFTTMHKLSILMWIQRFEIWRYYWVFMILVSTWKMFDTSLVNNKQLWKQNMYIKKL